MTEKITMIELFSGIGAQEKSIRQLGIEYDIINTCDCDKDAVLSYAAMRCDFEKELKEYEFPSQDKMIEELQAKNIGFDFQKGKHTITSRTPIEKLKQYYLADKLSKNLGDISKVERLPYADIVTYSSPCQSFSVAGKLGGAVKTCTHCGHKWDIDFSNPDYNYKCPICNNTSLESTTSGLLQEVQRLLSIAYEENTLPKYLLLENVKNLVGKKFIGQFNDWIKWLDSIGYNTQYKVLNAKQYGIPQNRERVFALSIRKDIDDGTFKFSETVPLAIRLKDILERDVPEKYYLPDDRIEKILNSTFMQEKKRIQMTDVCDTLLARDWKDPKCVPIEEEVEPIRLGGLYDDENGRHQAGSIWDKDTISPTLDTMQGGNRQPFIIDEIKVIGNYMPSNHDASRVVDIEGIAPTVKENHGTVTAIAEPQIIKAGQLEGSFDQSGRVYDPDGIAPTIMSNSHGKTSGGYTSPKVIVEEPEPFVVASRGRNPENPSDRTPGAPTEQRLEPNFSGCTNTLTSVQKDNYVAEPIVCEERKDEGIRLFKDDCVGTLRTIDACGDKRVIEPELMIEDIVFPVMVRKYPVNVEKLKTTLREHKCYSNKEIAEKLNKPLTLIEHWFRQDECFAIPDADMWFKLKELLNITTDEFDESIMTFEVKDGVYDKANRCYHIEGIAPTLTAASANEKIIEPTIDLKCLNSKGGRNGVEGLQPSLTDRVYDSEGVATACATSTYFMPGYLVSEGIRWRIRKLTTKECWRLMGFSDEDHDKAAKYVSASALYKQAGNSICTSCLISIFYSLFFKDDSSKYTQYLVHFNDEI